MLTLEPHFENGSPSTPNGFKHIKGTSANKIKLIDKLVAMSSNSEDCSYKFSVNSQMQGEPVNTDLLHFCIFPNASVEKVPHYDKGISSALPYSTEDTKRGTWRTM